MNNINCVENDDTARAILNASTESAFLIELDGTFIDMNNVTAERLNKKKEDLIGKNAYDYLSHQLGESRQKKVQEVVDSKSSVRFTDKRESMYFDINIYPIFDDLGEVVRLAIFGKDITAQKLNENKLILQNQILNILLNTSRENGNYGDILELILKEMESECGFFGYIDEKDNLVCPTMTNKLGMENQMPDETIVIPRSQWIGLWGKSLIDKKITIGNNNLFLPGGHIQIKRVLVCPFVVQSRLIGLLVLANKDSDYNEKDIDKISLIAKFISPILDSRLKNSFERKKRLAAENQVLENEKRLRLLADNSQDVIYRYEFLPKRKYSYISPSIYSILGYTQEEYYNDPDLGVNIIHPEDRKKLKEFIESGDSGKVAMEIRWIAKSGKILWTDQKIRWIRDSEGRVEAVEGIARDISQRKNNELKARKLNKLIEGLLYADSFTHKLDKITKNIVEIFNIDFVRIWILKKGDLCEQSCIHFKSVTESDGCKNQDFCLHLAASSGRYTNIEGEYKRVPLGLYKIGKIASGKMKGFIIDDIQDDPQIQHQEWVKELGLRTFGGFPLLSHDEKIMGVLVFFSTGQVSDNDRILISNISYILSQIILKSKAEEELFYSEKKYKALFSTAPSVILNLSSEGLILDLNHEAEKLYGVKKNEVIGKNYIETFLPEEVWDGVYKDIQKVINGNKTHGFENEVINSEGKKRILIWDVSPVNDEKLEKKGIIAIGRDITKRIEAEKILKERELKFRTLFEITSIPLIHINKNGQVINVNKKFVQEFGYTHSDVPDVMSWYTKAYPDPEYRKWAMGNWRNLSKEFENDHFSLHPFEARVSCKNGDICDIIISGNGTKDYILASCVNVTDFKLIQNSLKETKRILQAALDNSPATIAIAEAPEGKYIFVNQASLNLSGESFNQHKEDRDVIEFLSSWRMVHLDGSEYKEEEIPLTRAIKKNETVIEDLKIITPEGDERYVSVNAAPIHDEQGHVKFAIAIYFDITNRTVTEKKLKQVIKEKEVLIKEINHRVKNNLNILGSMISLQSSTVKDKNLISHFDNIRNRIKVLSIIHEKIYQTENINTIKMNDYLNSLIIKIYRSLVLDTETIDMNIDIADFVLDVKDAVSCAIIVNETITNAIKYAFPFKNKGIISVIFYKENDHYHLIVSDNGVGLPKDFDHSRSTGLGMNVLKTLVSQLNGTLAIKTQKGTHIHIQF